MFINGESFERFKRNSLIHYIIVFMYLFMYSRNNIHRTTSGSLFFAFSNKDNLYWLRDYEQPTRHLFASKYLVSWPPVQCPPWCMPETPLAGDQDSRVD